jgi:hypothetical protein
MGLKEREIQVYEIVKATEVVEGELLTQGSGYRGQVAVFSPRRAGDKNFFQERPFSSPLTTRQAE